MQKIADPNNLCQIAYKIITQKKLISLPIVKIELLNRFTKYQLSQRVPKK